MRRSALAIVAGLMLAVLAVAFVATIFAVPLAAPVDGETLPWRLLRSVLPIAAFALPGALLAIWLAEIRRVRGLAYWIFIGALLGLIGYVALAYVPWPQQIYAHGANGTDAARRWSARRLGLLVDRGPVVRHSCCAVRTCRSRC